MAKNLEVMKFCKVKAESTQRTKSGDKGSLQTTHGDKEGDGIIGRQEKATTMKGNSRQHDNTIRAECGRRVTDDRRRQQQQTTRKQRGDRQQQGEEPTNNSKVHSPLSKGSQIFGSRIGLKDCGQQNNIFNTFERPMAYNGDTVAHTNQSISLVPPPPRGVMQGMENSFGVTVACHVLRMLS